jgi:xanthine dehydrogenase accessory factor
MYGIAIAVTACVQAGTRADVAWLVGADGLDVTDWSDAVAFTPGGGRTGSILGGALDGKLEDLAGRWSTGRLLDLELTQVDALIAGLPVGGSVSAVMAPAETLPPRVWEMAAKREHFCVVADLDGDEVTSMSAYSADTIAEADPDTQELFRSGQVGSRRGDARVTSIFTAFPQMVVVGSTPVGQALVDLAATLDWQVHLVTQPGEVMGHIAPLSALDKVVVTGHDIELAGSALAAALDSEAGYIASLGSREMQAQRVDWLAYRGITELDRVHGPAGLDIGANTPAEIAVSIVAEAIAARHQG